MSQDTHGTEMSASLLLGIVYTPTKCQTDRHTYTRTAGFEFRAELAGAGAHRSGHPVLMFINKNPLYQYIYWYEYIPVYIHSSSRGVEKGDLGCPWSDDDEYDDCANNACAVNGKLSATSLIYNRKEEISCDGVSIYIFLSLSICRFFCGSILIIGWILDG